MIFTHRSIQALVELANSKFMERMGHWTFHLIMIIMIQNWVACCYQIYLLGAGDKNMYFSFKVEECNNNRISHKYSHFRIVFVEAISPVHLVTVRPQK